jgi:hypothetical protein
MEFVGKIDIKGSILKNRDYWRKFMKEGQEVRLSLHRQYEYESIRYSIMYHSNQGIACSSPWKFYFDHENRVVVIEGSESMIHIYDIDTYGIKETVERMNSTLSDFDRSVLNKSVKVEEVSKEFIQKVKNDLVDKWRKSPYVYYKED